MDTTTVWFAVVGVLWAGYLVLEGFDFGVGMLLGVLARDDRERRVLINTVGPVWDGNEVWVLTAVGAMFAAFPAWYAGLLSGWYLLVLLVLVALILRNLAFEFRHQRDDATWRARWDAALTYGSLVAAFGWGAILVGTVGGLPMGRDQEVTGGPFAALSPLALLGGLTFVVLCLAHGAMFLGLKTDGEVRRRARRVAPVLAGVAVVLVALVALVLQTRTGSTGSALAFVGSVAALLVAAACAAAGREGWAFTGTFLAIGLLVAGLFAALFPDVLPALPAAGDPAYGLTAAEASASAYTLRIMSWSAVVLVPVVLAYQSWTYWVFRRRISVRHIPAAH